MLKHSIAPIEITSNSAFSQYRCIISSACSFVLLRQQFASNLISLVFLMLPRGVCPHSHTMRSTKEAAYELSLLAALQTVEAHPDGNLTSDLLFNQQQLVYLSSVHPIQSEVVGKQVHRLYESNHNSAYNSSSIAVQVLSGDSCLLLFRYIGAVVFTMMAVHCCSTGVSALWYSLR